MPLRVTFLGTSGAVPTVERAPSAVHVRREGDALLFDCGEGTQRQMMRFGTGFDLEHLFVSHLDGDHVFGIPGLVQTMGLNERTRPLVIHGPPGTGRRLDRLVHAAGHDPSFPVDVVEATPGEVAVERDGYVVRAVATDHGQPSVGYALVEDDRPGRFDREHAEEELGIPPGPAYSRLHGGETVELDDGRVIEPEQVVGAPRPGRRVVYTGDTRPTDATVAAAEDADLLIHEAMFADDAAERAQRMHHSTAREAGAVAARAGARRLALTHISSRYGGDASQHEAEARETFDGDVFVAEDGQVVEVSYPDAADEDGEAGTA